MVSEHEHKTSFNLFATCWIPKNKKRTSMLSVLKCRHVRRRISGTYGFDETAKEVLSHAQGAWCETIKTPGLTFSKIFSLPSFSEVRRSNFQL